LRSKLEALLGRDPLAADVVDLAAATRRLARHERRRALRLCVGALERIVAARSRRAAQDVILAGVKVIVASLPDSAAIIERFLGARTGCAEVQFTLFCLLDRVHEIPSARKFTREAPRLLKRYFFEASTDAARAPWMAGDLRGEHWPLEEAGAILLAAVREARYVAGRVGALHGLSHLLRRARAEDPRLVRSILRALRSVARIDRSSNVRCEATWILSGGHPCARAVREGPASGPKPRARR
jgi:hypothetical protein